MSFQPTVDVHCDLLDSLGREEASGHEGLVDVGDDIAEVDTNRTAAREVAYEGRHDDVLVNRGLVASLDHEGQFQGGLRQKGAAR